MVQVRAGGGASHLGTGFIKGDQTGKKTQVNGKTDI